MSINVTVSGNPISIKRGKMVTTSDYDTKREFDKRRLMRLEQVRHQSKGIAENIRNKLKKTHNNKLSELEKQGEVKLKTWQAHKLLDLQNQYQEALSEIGLGHKQAEQKQKDDEVYFENLDHGDSVAKERGKIAAERLQIKKNKVNLKKAAPLQRKNMSKDVENERSHKMMQGKSKINKKVNEGFDSDSENQVPDLGLTSSTCDCSETENSEKSTVKFSKEQQTTFRASTTEKAAQTLPQEDVFLTAKDNKCPLDNRISQRIKRRHVQVCQPDYCDFVEKELPASSHKNVCTCCNCFPNRQEGELQLYSTKISSEAKEHEEPIKNQTNMTSHCICCNCYHRHLDANHTESSPNRLEKHALNKTDISPKTIKHEEKPQQENPKIYNESSNILTNKQKSQQKSPSKLHPKAQTSIGQKSPKEKPQIPTKPKVTLRSSKETPQNTRKPLSPTKSNENVHYYDHSNRFAKNYVPQKPLVGKIADEDLDYSPIDNEDEIREKMRRRDYEAHVRGQLAQERERAQREYRELLRKLPTLQKQERVGEIGLDKAKYHMSRERLEELERKRQNRLDNAYEELFVRDRKPTVVTLPRKNHDESAPSLNLGSYWDEDRVIPPPPQTKMNRMEKLSSMLESLTSQKEQLLQEIESTLPGTQVVTNGSDTSGGNGSKSRKSKRKRDERPASPTNSDLEMEGEVHNTRPKSGASPRKKAKKNKVKRLILQNTSTQTTPKMNAATSSCSCPPENLQKPCSCPTQQDFQILIKLKDGDNELPEVLVNPPVYQKNVKIISDEVVKSNKEEEKQKEKTKKSVSTSDKKSVSTEKSKKEQKSKDTPSWREQFSRASSQSTASTSYMDPPSFLNKRGLQNSTSNDKKLDPRLLTYIKKLLTMSHASIDDLTVSAASEVSTPSQSLVEMTSNNPLMQLKNVMDYFNLDAVEVQKQLTSMSEGSTVHYNTSGSFALDSGSDGDTRATRFKSCLEISSSKSDSKKNASNVKSYADMAETCTKKISDLTAMIEKVRAEKKQILETSPAMSVESNEKDVSTIYLDLPEVSSCSLNTGHDETCGKLIDIDRSYANKLKKSTPREVEEETRRLGSDEELLSRLQSLLKSPKSPKKTSPQSSKSPTRQPVKEIKTVSFSGFKETQPDIPLLNIPKLSKLEAPPMDKWEKDKKRPPPSKGLKALNGNIPHELSTIIEADSQLSTKADSPVKTVTDILPVKNKSSDSSDKSEIEAMENMLQSIGMEWAIPTLKKTREALALTSSSNDSSKKSSSSDVSLREFLSKISSSTVQSEPSPGSLLSDTTQEISIIQMDNRRTSTPVDGTSGGAMNDLSRSRRIVFSTSSDLSSVRESDKTKEVFYDLNEGSASKNASNGDDCNC